MPSKIVDLTMRRIRIVSVLAIYVSLMTASLWAQELPQNATDLVRAAVKNELKQETDGLLFAFKERTEKPKGTTLKQMVETPEGVIGRVLLSNDKPLTPEQVRGEDDRVNRLLDSRQWRDKVKEQKEDEERTCSRRMTESLGDHAAHAIKPATKVDGVQRDEDLDAARNHARSCREQTNASTVAIVSRSAPGSIVIRTRVSSPSTMTAPRPRASSPEDRTSCAMRMIGVESPRSLDAHHLSVLAANPRPTANRSALSPLARQLETRCFQIVRVSAMGDDCRASGCARQERGRCTGYLALCFVSFGTAQHSSEALQL